MPTIATLPEELLERILHLCVSSPPFPPARPAWHRDHRQQSRQQSERQSQNQPLYQADLPSRSQTLPSILTTSHDRIPNTKGKHRKLSSPPPTTTSRCDVPALANARSNRPKTEKIRTRLAPLLVCRLFNRIATPAFYETILLRSEWQAGSLAWTLKSSANLRSITHLVLRKAHTVYLTQGSVKTILGGVADGIMKWEELETVYIGFRLSDDSLGSFSTPPFTSTSPPSTASPVLPSPGPSTLLTNALISSPSPHLHTLITPVPSVWNTLLKRVVEGRAHPPSTSPAPAPLDRLVLIDGSTAPLFDLGVWGAGAGFSCADKGSGRIGMGISFGEEDDDDDTRKLDSNMFSPPSAALSPTFPSSAFSPTFPSPLSPSLTASPAASLYLNEAQNHGALADAIRAGTRWLRRRSVLQAGAASSGNVGMGVGAYGMTGYRARAYTMGSTSSASTATGA
ncbi:hypothetical protein PLEOSDRAFT_1114425 [Pleurotus ostreatus PC15]|uniref:Uncharacterized protein n=1 Tax=Pleurotus ostreatus (strain PC15) TaxID=1137138 RepID=A0A067NH39_PLEO1|nr:hypothetical protein PLEOSDRAFT_1114425 [Pleurotus ostreatus PC15]